MMHENSSITIFRAMVRDAVEHLKGMTLTEREMLVVIDSIELIERELKISEHWTGVKLR